MPVTIDDLELLATTRIASEISQYVNMQYDAGKILCIQNNVRHVTDKIFSRAVASRIVRIFQKQYNTANYPDTLKIDDEYTFSWQSDIKW
jgi:hypothetical protein